MRGVEDPGIDGIKMDLQEVGSEGGTWTGFIWLKMETADMSL
jgi:hypothetical protein